MYDHLDGLLALAGHHAQTVLVDLKMRSLVPTWVLVNDNAQVQIVGTPWDDEHEKNRVARKMRFEMRRRKTIAYSFVTEAWTATVEAHELDLERRELKDPMRKPAHRADRQEVVIACAADKSGVMLWRQWRIVRDWQDQIVRLEEKPFPFSVTEHQPQSWLAEMLQ